MKIWSGEPFLKLTVIPHRGILSCNLINISEYPLEITLAPQGNVNFLMRDQHITLPPGDMEIYHFLYYAPEEDEISVIALFYAEDDVHIVQAECHLIASELGDLYSFDTYIPVLSQLGTVSLLHPIRDVIPVLEREFGIKFTSGFRQQHKIVNIGNKPIEEANLAGNLYYSPLVIILEPRRSTTTAYFPNSIIKRRIELAEKQMLTHDQMERQFYEIGKKILNLQNLLVIEYDPKEIHKGYEELFRLLEPLYLSIPKIDDEIFRGKIQFTDFLPHEIQLLEQSLENIESQIIR